MLIDPDSPTPLYAQVETALAAQIANGMFAVGSRLPNEEELVEQFAVSRTTIRQTIQNLVRRGLVEIRRERGLSSPSLKSPRSSHTSPAL